MNESIPGEPKRASPLPEAEAFLWGGRESHDFSAPLGGVTQGLLRFASGASRLTLHVDASMPELFRARFVGPVPEVRVQNGTLTFRHPHSFSDWLQYALPWSQAGGEITLNGSIPWQLDFHAGVSAVSGDLSQLPLRSLDVAGGASHLRLKLPRPSNIVPIHIHGGASHVTLHRPVGVAAQVEIGGGAAHLSFDEVRIEAIGGSSRLVTPGLEDRAHRYQIHVHGGASHLLIDSR